MRLPFVLFVVNVPLCWSAFYESTKPIEIEMKLSKLRMIAFSYSEHVNLYYSDKGDKQKTCSLTNVQIVELN